MATSEERAAPLVSPTHRPPVSRGIAWAVGVFAALVLAATTVVSMGFAAVVWLPLLLLLGGTMCTVWAARRRRQLTEGRDAAEMKDPVRAPRDWPKRDIIDDRL